MKNRSKAYTRHQRERAIQRKWVILKNAFHYEDGHFPARGKLSKGHIGCSCKMCKYEKIYDIPKPKHKAKLEAMRKEIDF